MNHLTEEELVDRYDGSAAGAEEARAAEAHLNDCSACAAALASLEGDLTALRALAVPERDENYGEQMWARVEAALPPRSAKRGWAATFAAGRLLAYAGGCAALALGAFYLGRVWEQRHSAPIVAQHAPAAPQAQQPKVVVVLLGDHLDRSERLLVELKHTDSDTDRADLEPLKNEARSLLAANHVFRADVQDENDPALAQTLGRLDNLLTEIASQPDGLDAAQAARIRHKMNAEGLLFEVRVLRSKNPHRTTAVRVVQKGGAA